jgi:ATP-dependent DNA helicase RecG
MPDSAPLDVAASARRAAAQRTSPGKRKPRVVTERLDPAQRRVGGLSVFGIRDFWRVPTILPKRFMDLRAPLTSFAELAGGQWVCVGGRPARLARLPDRSEQIDPKAEEPSLEASADPEPGASDAEEADSSPKRVPRWSFELVDLRQRRLRVEIEQQTTKADEQLLDRLRRGDPLWLHGLLHGEPDDLQLLEAEPVTPAQLGEVLAFYPSRSVREFLPSAGKAGRKRRTKGRFQVRKISSAVVGALVREKNRLAVGRCAAALRQRMELADPLDEWELLELVDSPIPTLEGTLKLAHSPPDVATGEQAIRALERLSAIELLQHIQADRLAVSEPAEALRMHPRHVQAAIDSVREHAGITLTGEQTLAVTEILADLAAPHRTHRLLSGDCGSGKTIVFLIVAAVVHAAGGLVVVLEPRAQLAEQVHRNVARFFPHIPSRLLSGASTDETALERGIVVGTTAVWSRLAASGCRPSLIVCDEQQKLGVFARRPEQHAESHLLEATATPIPRTQGLIEFGGLEVSVLRGRHVANEITTTVLLGRTALERLYKRLAQRVRQDGLNLMLVFPLIAAPDDEEDAVAEAPPLAVEEAIAHWESILPGRVGVVHGRVPHEQRSRAIQRFDSGEDKVLIGTTILEVGIDLRKADMMIIHHPERLGVAAVHQLRGRLARQGGRGWCYLACSPEVSESQLELLRLMEIESDGFKLAIADMLRRGVGDMRPQARQQSGAYQGFLVQRTPSIEDLEWAMENCQRWLRRDERELDLLADPLADLRRMAQLAARARPPTRAAPPASGDVPPGGEQIDLFGP